MSFQNYGEPFQGQQPTEDGGAPGTAPPQPQQPPMGQQMGQPMGQQMGQQMGQPMGQQMDSMSGQFPQGGDSDQGQAGPGTDPKTTLW